MAHRVLITGAAGFIGRCVMHELAAQHPDIFVLGVDLRPPTENTLGANQRFEIADIRTEAVSGLLRSARIDVVVHLASIVSPPPGMSRETMHETDVGGTRKLLDGVVQAGVTRFIVTTSGAAYGYHADNPVPLDEADALRGNPEFAYADHKRQVEELLADYRARHVQLQQLVFRPGTVLGKGLRNQITALFEKRVILGVAGSDSPFVIIWDEDVAACIIAGITGQATGIYNLAGDGTVTLREIARLLGKPYVPIPAGLIAAALAILQRLGLSQYGPEQVNFLRYRPVLSNRRLKKEFGYTPTRSSLDCFRDYARGAGLLAG